MVSHKLAMSYADPMHGVLALLHDCDGAVWVGLLETHEEERREAHHQDAHGHHALKPTADNIPKMGRVTENASETRIFK